MINWIIDCDNEWLNNLAEINFYINNETLKMVLELQMWTW